MRSWSTGLAFGGARRRPCRRTAAARPCKGARRSGWARGGPCCARSTTRRRPDRGRGAKRVSSTSATPAKNLRWSRRLLRRGRRAVAGAWPARRAGGCPIRTRPRPRREPGAVTSGGLRRRRALGAGATRSRVERILLAVADGTAFGGRTAGPGAPRPRLIRESGAARERQWSGPEGRCRRHRTVPPAYGPRTHDSVMSRGRERSEVDRPRGPRPTPPQSGAVPPVRGSPPGLAARL